MVYLNTWQPEAEIWHVNNGDLHDKCRNYLTAKNEVHRPRQIREPTCHQRDRADVTEFVTLMRLSSLGQHVGVLALAGYKRPEIRSDAGPYWVLLRTDTWNLDATHRHKLEFTQT